VVLVDPDIPDFGLDERAFIQSEIRNFQVQWFFFLSSGHVVKYPGLFRSFL